MLGKRFPLKMKDKVYRCCIRSTILYGSETWCLKENEKAILKRMERAMDPEVSGKRKRGRSKKTWKKQVKETEIGLKKEDALNRAKWRDGVQAIAEEIGRIRLSLLRGQHRIIN